MTRNGGTGAATTYVYTLGGVSETWYRNGLNQITAINSASVTYDANQNATSVSGNIYSYDAANRLTSATPSGGSAAAFVFDPQGRLASSTVGATTTRYQYAGAQLAAEYDASGTVTRRYVPGLGLDSVVTAYTGSGVGTRDWLLADERGSVMALSGSNGAVSTINRYDEYGTPASGNAGRFGYTGQPWMVEAGAWHYRARTYLPQIGRFLQPDPIGYAAGQNLYGYVGMDPVNRVDPWGLQTRRNGETMPRDRCEPEGGDLVTRNGREVCLFTDNIVVPVSQSVGGNDSSSSPGDGGNGSGSESETCRIGRRILRENISSLPSYVTQNSGRWNSVEHLRFWEGRGVASQDFGDGMSWPQTPTGLSTIVGLTLQGVSRRAGPFGIGVGLWRDMWGWESDRGARRAAAARARILQLENSCE